jgi:flagellar biosynthesis protein
MTANRDTRSGADESTTPEVAALAYDPDAGHHAPKLVARGRGHIADKILEIAGDLDIPVRKDPTLLSILAALEVGSEVPPDLYGVIAEVLAWAYRTDNEALERVARKRAA